MFTAFVLFWVDLELKIYPAGDDRNDEAVQVDVPNRGSSDKINTRALYRVVQGPVTRCQS